MTEAHRAPRRPAPVRSSRTTRRRLLALPVTGAAALALVLSGCGADEDATSAVDATASPTTESPTAASPTTDSPTPDSGTSAASGTALQPGQLIVGGTSVFELAARSDADAVGELAELAGAPAFGTELPVLSVPTDEGFWVGTPDSGRMWVQLTEQGESPADVAPGDVVTFQGILVSHDEAFVQGLGLPEEEATALTDIGHHVEVPSAGDLTID
ncbi:MULTISPECIES: hypothetical protein [unclassified Modestobacter]